MADRGTYGQAAPEHASTATTVGMIALALVGVLVAPVIAVVGGTALAAAVSGRGGRR